MSLLISLLFCALCGFLASKLMGLEGPWFVYVLLGLVGGLVGDVLFSFIGLGSYSTIGNVIVSVIGACVVIYLYRKLMK